MNAAPTGPSRLSAPHPRRAARARRRALLTLYLLALCTTALVAQFVTLDQLLALLRTASALFLLNTLTYLAFQIGMALVTLLHARARQGPAPRPTFILIATTARG